MSTTEKRKKKMHMVAWNVSVQKLHVVDHFFRRGGIALTIARGMHRVRLSSSE